MYPLCTVQKSVSEFPNPLLQLGFRAICVLATLARLYIQPFLYCNAIVDFKEFSLMSDQV